LTLRHYTKAFASRTGHGLLWTGAAWNSFWTTITLSAIAAPVTAALGILTASSSRARSSRTGRVRLQYDAVVRHSRTVIGVAYILAFNVPPIEITGS
jgi:iron(III) transport system permease protein